MKLINTAKIVAVICMLLLTFSCKENTDGYHYGDVDAVCYFSFKEEVTIIEVDESVKSFTIEALALYEPPYHFNYFPIMIDKENTTARHKVHFINKVDGTYESGEGLRVFQTIELIPENITSELEILYYSTRWNNNEGDVEIIEKTTIKLIPKNKK